MTDVSVDGAMALAMARIGVLEELVRWLSLPYGENEPVFAGADGRATVNGQPLGNAPQLRTLWYQTMAREPMESPVVMVTGEDGITLPVDRRRWVKCELCQTWHVEVS